MNAIDQLLERYKPKDPNFKITLPGGESYEFRHFKDADDFELFLAGATNFLEYVPIKGSGVEPKKPHASWKKYLPSSRRVMSEAFLLHYLSVSPRIEQIDALKLTTIPHIFRRLVDGVEAQRNFRDDSALEKEIEEKKEPSGETHTEGSD